jgi:hypothetical protein
MLFRKMIIIYSTTHMKHINTLCGQNSEFVNVKVDGTAVYHSFVRSCCLQTIIFCELSCY